MAKPKMCLKPMSEQSEAHWEYYLIRHNQKRNHTMFMVKKMEERSVSMTSCFQLIFERLCVLTR